MQMTSMNQLVCEIPFDETARQKLASLPGLKLQMLPLHERRWDMPDEWLLGTDILACKFPPGNLEKMTDLKFLQLATVGYEHLRDVGLATKPFPICNARGIFDTAIAEWNLAMMVNLTRDLRGMIRDQETGRWERAEHYQQELRGRVAGLWGYGGIGRETARLAKAFGMGVHVMTRTGVKPRPDAYALPGTADPEGVLPDRVFVTGQEGDFLAGLDFLILALPRTRHSNGMIGEAQLQALPRTAFVLNPARGPIIQEAALVRALHEGWIAGAALDTHFAYPLPAEHPLWGFPNVILTPHIAGADHSREFPGRFAGLLAENVSRFLGGQRLLNQITREEWDEV